MGRSPAEATYMGCSGSCLLMSVAESRLGRRTPARGHPVGLLAPR
jgi:hypothetical protein